MEEQEKYQQMLNALNDEDRLKLRNALEDLDSSLLETSMEDLEGFVKEKYPNAKIVQGNVVEDGQIIGKTTDLYKKNAYDNFIEELYDEQFQKSLGIKPNSNILSEGELKNKTFVEDGVTYSIENVDPLDDFDGPAYDAQTMDRDIPNQIDEDYAQLLQENSITDGDIVDMDDIDKPITDVDNQIKNNLADDVPKGKKLLSILKWLDPVEEAIASGLSAVGLTGAAATYAIAEASNFIGNLFFEGLRSQADIDLINSKILTGKATDKEVKELNDKIIENFKLGTQRAAKVSPAANVTNWIGKMLDR
jgi:hypothetical protein